MAEVSLVISDLDRGRRSLEVLDRNHIPVDAAFWYLDDDDVWQFCVSTPLLRNTPRKSVYRKIRDALVNEDGTLRLREITVLPASSELLRRLRTAFKVGGPADISEARLTGNTIDGEYIKDVLAYRL